MTTEQEDVPDQEHQDAAGQDAGVESEKPSERVVAVVRPADDQPLQGRAEDGYNAHDIGRHFGGPVPFLVPGQQVAHEREREHELEKAQAEPEIDLARSAVGAVDDHLHQVQHEQYIHHRRGEVMDAAQQPAGGHFVLNKIDAFPRGLRTRAVRHPKEEAREELHGQAKDESAAPDVAPARAARDVFVQGILDDPPVTRSTVEPLEQGFHQTGILSFWPARKFRNLTQISFPFRSSTSSSSRPRGLGLFGSAIWPSRAKRLLWQGQ